MKKMKKLVSMFLCALLMLSAFTAYADDSERRLLDPYNNSLFEVVCEIQISDELIAPFGSNGGMYFPVKFEYHIMTPATEEGLVNAVKIKVNYDGTVSDEVVASGITTAEMDKILYPATETNEGKFNDGLACYSKFDEIEDMSFTCYKDINGKEYFEGADFYTIYDYNLGLLRINEWMPNYTTGIDEEYTTFIKIMGDKSEYEFEGSIGIFNDDGYAIMDINKGPGRSVDDVFYIVKLKEYPIPTVSLNGQKILFDQIPVSQNNRLLVPMRAIFEKIGATVAWDGATSTITAEKADTRIELKLDSTTAFKNGAEMTLDVPATAVNGRTLVPVRFVADCFGVDVEWIGEKNHVKLTQK